MHKNVIKLKNMSLIFTRNIDDEQKTIDKDVLCDCDSYCKQSQQRQYIGNPGGPPKDFPGEPYAFAVAKAGLEFLGMLSEGLDVIGQHFLLHAFGLIEAILICGHKFRFDIARERKRDGFPGHFGNLIPELFLQIGQHHTQLVHDIHNGAEVHFILINQVGRISQ